MRPITGTGRLRNAGLHMWMGQPFLGGRAFAEVSTMPGLMAVKRLHRRLPRQLQYLFDIQGLPLRAGATPAQARFPLAIFNHGYLSYAAQHTALFEHLAANGYVVLSVGHPWESGGIVYPNGDAILGSPRILQDMMHIGQALGAKRVTNGSQPGLTLRARPSPAGLAASVSLQITRSPPRTRSQLPAISSAGRGAGPAEWDGPEGRALLDACLAP